MTRPLTAPDLEYPESDGQPMAESELDTYWAELIATNLRRLFGPTAFVGVNLPWYPVRDRPDISYTPAVLVALGRPAGDREVYAQWTEDGTAPHATFDFVSRCTTEDGFEPEPDFWKEQGVEERYILNPKDAVVSIAYRQCGKFYNAFQPFEYVSRRLGIRFEKCDGELEIFGRDGVPFSRPGHRERALNERVIYGIEIMNELRLRLSSAESRARLEKNRAAALAAKLRAAGIDPDAP